MKKVLVTINEKDYQDMVDHIAKGARDDRSSESSRSRVPSRPTTDGSSDFRVSKARTDA